MVDLPKKDVVVISGEFAVSDALPVLEIEHEPCSDKLPTVSNVAESAIDQALEALHLRSTPPVPEASRDESESPAASESKPTPRNPSRSESRSSSRCVNRPQLKSTSRVYEALRSRRLRIIATAVGVLLVVGLIGWNWQSSKLPKLSDELAEMDLSDFKDDLHFGAKNTGRASDPRPLGEITDAEAVSLYSQPNQSDSGERFPPVGLVNHSEQGLPSSGIQTVGGFSQPATRGSQGAWLTGQIEIESLGTPQNDSLSRTNDIAETR